MFVQTVRSRVLLQRYKFFLNEFFSPVYPQGDLVIGGNWTTIPSKILNPVAGYVCFS